MERAAHSDTQSRVDRRADSSVAEPESLAEFLRQRHPINTAAHVAAAVNRAASWARLSHRTAQKWLEGSTAPSLRHAAGLAAAYGPEALAAAFPARLKWLDDAARKARREEVDRKIAELEALREGL